MQIRNKKRSLSVLGAIVPFILLFAGWRIAALRPRQIALPLSSNGNLVLSPNGESLLYWREGENEVALRNLAAGTEQTFKTHGWASYCFSPDSRSFAILSLQPDGTTQPRMAHVEFYETTSRKLVRRFNALSRNDNPYLRGQSVRFSHDQKTLLVAVEKGMQILPLDGSQRRLISWKIQKERTPVAWNEKYLLMQFAFDTRLSEMKRYLEIYDLQTHRLLRSVRLTRDQILSAQTSPDSNLVAVSDEANARGGFMVSGTSLINFKTGKTLWQTEATNLTFLPDSRSIVVQNNDSTSPKLSLLDARTGKAIQQLKAPAAKLNLAGGAFSPDGKNLYVVDTSRSRATVWKLRVE